MSDGDLGSIVGLAYALFAGHILTRPVSRRAWGRVDPSRRDRPQATGHQDLHPAIVGYLERLAVAGAWMLGRPELAGAWLVLKAAAVWRTWEDDRGVFNVFLIGTGTSVVFGVAGGLIAELVSSGDWTRAGAVGVGTAAFAVLMANADHKGPDLLFR